MSVIDKIRHYQRSIDKSNEDQERILYCIKKLYILPVTVQHLQETGVGRTVNNLRKYDGSIGDAAKALVAKWKEMVVDEGTSEEEDEACVPDVPESYSDYSPQSPTPTQDAPKPATSKKDISAQKHRHKAGTSGTSNTDHGVKHGSKEESIGNSESKSSKGNSQKHEKHEKSKHSSKSESKSEKRSSSKDSKNNKSSSKKDEEHNLKDKDLSKSSGSKKNSDKLPNNSKLIEDKHDHRKRKLDNSFDDKKGRKRRKSSQESDEDNEQHSSDSEKSSNKSNYLEIQSKSLKESFENKSKQEHYYSPKEEDKSEKKVSQEKNKSSSSKPRIDESLSNAKDSEDKHRHKHKHKNDKDTEKKTEKKKDSTYHSDKDSSKLKSHQSSSSSKHDSENKDKSKKKEHTKEKGKKDADPKSCKKDVKDKKIKQEINGDEGIDCNSGASFAEALGMCTMMPSRKRNNNSPTLQPAKVKTEPNTPSQSSNKKAVLVKTEPADSSSSNPLPLLSPNVKLEPLNVDLASTLPEISPNYKPLPYVNHVQRKQEDKALTDVIYSKNQRTKVYSGNKSGYTSVPSLYELCIRVLIENIDALEFTGGVPYDIIKPVLERATADQLFMLEHYNPYLIEDTDSLWQFHCKREFRNKEREEMESWREMYMRCLDEREAKLKTLTANIKQSIDKLLPVRSTKLAYVDNIVKPPRNVLKKQAKYGTAGASSTSDLKKKLIAGGGPTSTTNISVPPPPIPRMRTSTSTVVKKTKAPLMAKALQLIKGRYKR